MLGLCRQAYADNEGDDNFTGTNDADAIDGGPGYDPILGRNGNDIIIGGPQDDYLLAKADDDIYRFSAGFGHDTIEDNVSGWIDVVEFDGTLDPADLRVKLVRALRSSFCHSSAPTISLRFTIRSTLNPTGSNWSALPTVPPLPMRSFPCSRGLPQMRRSFIGGDDADVCSAAQGMTSMGTTAMMY